MEGQSEVINLLDKGGLIIRDFLKEVTTFRVINGSKVKRFPLALLDYLKKRELVELKVVESMHSVYKRKKPKPSEMRLEERK